MSRIIISIQKQQLYLFAQDRCLNVYPVSTAINGAGEYKHSGCTPRGKHYIRACIGAGLPTGAVLVSRRFTGEIYSPELAKKYPKRDWILSRILWLCGKEIGCNRLGLVDTMQRYIYIHGTPDTEPMLEPKSHGCIRMRNSDIIRLFNQVIAGVDVLITAD